MIWKNKKMGGTLYKHLRHKAKKYNRRGEKHAGRGLIPNRRDIDERPIIVEEKKRLGDFELDTIVGANHKGTIVSIIDRCSKITRLMLVSNATSDRVSLALKHLHKPFKEKNVLHTLTADNGKEFAAHKDITDELGGEFFFAKPYHSWQRGLNEHTNGLVRQYFPKGTDFTILTQEQILNVEYKLNNRPRKCLHFLTPCEAFDRMINDPSLGTFGT
jgi:IS30 family transposase